MVDPAVVDAYPLTPLQQGMLFHHLEGTNVGVDIYNPSDESTDTNQLQWTNVKGGWEVKPQPIESLGTSNCSQVLVWPARTSASALSMKCSAQAAAYAWK